MIIAFIFWNSPTVNKSKKNWLLKEEKGARQSRLCIGKCFNELASRSFVAIGQYCVHVLDKAVTLEQQIYFEDGVVFLREQGYIKIFCPLVIGRWDTV